MMSPFAPARPMCSTLLPGSEQAKLTALDAAAYDYFGSSVAISGDYAIVGAYGNDGNGSYSGSAYMFTIPEPHTLLLAALASMGLTLRRRRSAR